MSATETEKKVFQVHDGTFGVALYEGVTAKEALTAYLLDRMRCAASDMVRVTEDGEATAEYDGVTYTTRALDTANVPWAVTGHNG